MTPPMPMFTAFPKIPRLRRGCYISEKIDGTNAQIVITPEGEIFAGSRNRWITPEADNAGFARWVQENKDELLKLGVGQHFGEWWGQGIQRGYGLTEKRFSLFNAGRWSDGNGQRPACCSVVPFLAAGPFTDTLVQETLDKLRSEGSVAAPGWMRPEGVVVWLTAAGTYYKVLLEGDELPKSLTEVTP